MVKPARYLPETKSGASEEVVRLKAALHEVSNALTVVIGWVSELRSRPGSSEFREGLEVTRRHARLGYKIARQAVGAPIDDEPQVQSAFALTTSVVKGMSQEAGRRGIALKEHQLGPDTLMHDAEVALQILLNLMLNALAFSKPGSTVTLEVSRAESAIVFAVSDEGPGVPVELRTRIFRGGVSLRPGGAGIGLAHCRELAHSSNAELDLAETETGARFELRWPVGEALSTTVQRVVHPSLIAGMRIVVLEDDPAVVALLELGLDSQGVELVTTSSLADLIVLLEDDRAFDAALVDLSPLGSDPARDLAVFQHARIPVVLISGDSACADAELNVCGHVRKPFEIGEVCEALARVHSAGAP